jgi:DNA-binding transcriptional regulator YiaG
MTPTDLKDSRRRLGLSQTKFAALCRVESARTVRRWEKGERDIPGPVVRLLEAINALELIEREAFIHRSTSTLP